jgi:hypothetical protein
MAQFLRPDGEITSSSITGSYLDIDEVSVSNTDFIVSTGTGTSQYECSTSNVAAPGAGTWTVRYTCAQVDGTTPDAGGTAATLDVTLYQGATLISSDTQRTQDGAWTTYSWNLTAGEVSNITDADDLRIRFDMVNSGGTPSGRRQYAVSHAELEVPDATDDLTASEIQSNTEVDSATLTQNHQLAVTEIQSLTEVDTPLFTGISLLGNATEIESATEVDNPLFTGISVLPTVTEIQSLTEVDTPTISQVHNLLATEISSLTEVDNPLFTGISLLGNATEIESASEVDTPTVGQNHSLLATEIQSLTEVDAPVIGQIHNLLATEISSLSEVDIINITQNHQLISTEIESATEVDTPTVGQNHSLLATEIQSATEVDNPTISEFNGLTATEIESATTIRSPIILEDNSSVIGFQSYVANVAYSIGTTSSVTSWHTLHSVNTNCLVVMMSFQASDVTASPSKTYTLTYGGNPMTAAVSYDPPDNDFSSLIYYLLDPPTTNSQLSISTNDAFRNITVSLLELGGIDTGNPIGNTQTASAETVAITPSQGNSVIVSVKATKEIGAGQITPSTNNIELIDYAGGGL